VTLTRLLLASTAISLGGLGFSHAAPISLVRSLSVQKPAVMHYLTPVQLSIDDAEAALAAAVARLAEVEASGGDVAVAQADVAAAQAELATAQAALQGTVEPVPAPEAAAEPAPEAASEPAAVEEAPAAPSAEVAPVPAAEPEVIIEAAPEPAPAAEQPAAESAPVEVAPEPAPETPEAPAQPEATAPAPEAAVPAAKPAAEPEAAPEAPIEPEPAAEPAADANPEQAPAEAVAPTPEPKPAAAPQAAPATATPSESAPSEPAASEPAPSEPAQAEPAQAEPAPVEAGKVEPVAPTPSPAVKPSQDAQPATQPENAAKTLAAPKEEVLTLPVEGGAPVLDSAKEEPAPSAEGSTAPAAAPAPSTPAAPPPTSDAEAQAPALRSAPAPQALSEAGVRVAAPPAPEAQTNVTIINQIDNRTIIEVDNRTIIEHDERDRLRAGSQEVYYDRLSGGRMRETIVRPNGVQLVTITNRWGDVIQRSRVMPDGREYVLFYATANSDGSREAFVDPGRRLAPLRLAIPIDEYILDATEARPSAFLDFLMEPPVEQVERLYSVEEVRRSARIRDKVRRIDLDTLTFEFGKATIAEDQIQRLSDVADAMTRILERNPAETFLIEGHTDAVGRDEANLLLSDRRAETIAVALSDVFGIPPENLVTQGYGERYLKVRTEAPERLNRRVTIRRITPLVTPVASR